MTITATKEADNNANIRDLNLVIVTEDNIALFKGLNPRLGDIYKQVLLPSGGLVFMGLRVLSVDDMEDRIAIDKVHTESSTISIGLRYPNAF